MVGNISAFKCLFLVVPRGVGAPAMATNPDIENS
jgi:hypothetical protein